MTRKARWCSWKLLFEELWRIGGKDGVCGVLYMMGEGARRLAEVDTGICMLAFMDGYSIQ